MANRNLTVQLDDDVIRRAKVLAAKRGTSVSALVAGELERLVADDERYEDAWRRAQRALAEAAPRGGRRWQRDELHER
jgi:sugar phosphate isomerase/epimerase